MAKYDESEREKEFGMLGITTISTKLQTQLRYHSLGRIRLPIHPVLISVKSNKRNISGRHTYSPC